MKRQITRYMLGLVALISLAACGTPAAPTTGAASPPAPSADKPKVGANGVVLTIRTEGGHCVYGGCWAETEIRADGSYHFTDGTGADREGTLGAEKGAELTQLIAATNFDDVRAKPFTGTCPIAFDGQMQIYTFQTLSGAQKIDSCQVAIDEASPLFSGVGGLVATINQ